MSAINSAPMAHGTLWFAKHEINLSWRDFMRMMSAGKKGREKGVIAVLTISFVVIHLIAYFLLKPFIDGTSISTLTVWATITGTLVLTLSLMMSQAMEMVTRVFYSRSDLDLIMSSPAALKRVFLVRIGAIALSASLLSMALFGPAINILAIFDNVVWLAAYPIVLACGAVAASLSLLLVTGMFNLFGAKRTRLITQIVAAMVGAGFIIGVQLAAIASLGTVSRYALFTSDFMTPYLPVVESWLWLPARATMGEPAALIAVMSLSLALLMFVISVSAERFGDKVIVAAGLSETTHRHKVNAHAFSNRSVGTTLRNKEWKLLLRDHWLISQSLMQILYLIPPAFMLWQGYGDGNGISIIAIPVLVMAAGQLSGGLAWLTISGEDAPQLVSTAPIRPGSVIRAKIEAVLYSIAFLTSPILALLLWFDWKSAIIAATAIAGASMSATMIQLWFRSQAKRASFRRRQTSSKVATFAEAFSSIFWAGTAGLLVAGQVVFATITLVLICLVLWTARSFRPEENI